MGAGPSHLPLPEPCKRPHPHPLVPRHLPRLPPLTPHGMHSQHWPQAGVREHLPPPCPAPHSVLPPRAPTSLRAEAPLPRHTHRLSASLPSLPPGTPGSPLPGPPCQPVPGSMAITGHPGRWSMHSRSTHPGWCLSFLATAYSKQSMSVHSPAAAAPPPTHPRGFQRVRPHPGQTSLPGCSARPWFSRNPEPSSFRWTFSCCQAPGVWGPGCGFWGRRPPKSAALC